MSAPIFAMIGGASFILAFAFQDTLGNLANGLMIMINRPFDEGDYVLVGGVGGTVKTVSIVATTVNTPDNQVIVIPNKNVWGNVITNVTASDTRRIDLVFGISYDDSIEDAQKVMDEVVHAHPLVLKDPEPVIRVHELGASSVNFVCRPWALTTDYWDRLLGPQPPDERRLHAGRHFHSLPAAGYPYPHEERIGETGRRLGRQPWQGIRHRTLRDGSASTGRPSVLSTARSRC
jgi:small-conductance mechanosensitive channel